MPRKVIGFYTDDKDRVRPITSKSKRRFKIQLHRSTVDKYQLVAEAEKLARDIFKDNIVQIKPIGSAVSRVKPFRRDSDIDIEVWLKDARLGSRTLSKIEAEKPKKLVIKGHKVHFLIRQVYPIQTTLRDFPETKPAVEDIEKMLKQYHQKLKELQQQKKPTQAQTKLNYEIKWKKPEYSRDTRYKIVEMSPTEFLSKVPSPGREGHTALEDLEREEYWSKSSINYLFDKIKKGESLEMPMLDYTREFRGFPTHEGRHTALVAYKLGVDKMPVVVIS